MNRLAVLAAAGVMTGSSLVAGTAIAGHVGGESKSFTGCLRTKAGTLAQLKRGDAPLSRCGKGKVVVHLSGGDLTTLTAAAGGGLVGGGTNGAVSLSLRRDCQQGQIVKWKDGAWGCASDSDSTATAGTGLEATGNAFSIQPAYRVRNAPDCASGQFAVGFDAEGAIQCATPPSPAATVFASFQAGVVAIPGDNTERQVVALTVPAGTYAITAVGQVTGPLVDFRIACRLLAAGSSVTESFGHGHSYAHGSVAMFVLRTFAGTTALSVTCNTDKQGVSTRELGVQAIRVGA